MDLTMPTQREKVTFELKRAIQNINRNLYEWKKFNGGRTNFSISLTEVYSLTKNWLTRCLRSTLDAATVDRIFRTGYLFISVNDSELCIGAMTVGNFEPYRSYYRTAMIVSEILDSLDFQALRYNPDDYKQDGVTQRTDEFYYPRYEPSFSPVSLVSYDSLTPKT